MEYDDFLSSYNNVPVINSPSIDTEVDDDNLDDDILLLTEADIPGASLDGKNPTELNISQLRRWLACRGAPLNGKKPELIQR